MKRHLILCGLLIAGAFFFKTGVFAQTAKSAELRASEQTRIMRTELNLSDSQIQTVYTINRYIDEYFDELEDRNYTNPGIIYKSLRQLGMKKNELMESVLTYKQYVTYLKKEKKGEFAVGHIIDNSKSTAKK